MKEEQIIANYLQAGHPTAFGSPGVLKLYYGDSVSLRQINKILSKIDAHTKNKQHKELARNPTYVNQLRELWQIDLAFVNHLSADNDGVMYLLNCIDCFSRFLYCRPLKNKKAMTFLKAFESILKQSKIPPKRLCSDKGTEIRNKLFLDYLAKKNITYINNNTSQHAHFVERVNYSLKVLIMKYLSSVKQNRYIDVLPKLVRTYNTRKHRSINMSPYEAEIPKNSLKVRMYLSRNRKQEKKKPKYKVGQKVRISIEKKTFFRGFHQRSTDEIFTITSVKTNLPLPLYSLRGENDEENLEGNFYEFELSPVNVQ